MTLFLLSFTYKGQSQIDYLRYNDDFNYLKSDSVVRKGTENFKFIPFGNRCNISLGGEVREQFQYYHNSNFGDLPSGYKPNTSRLWHRAMTHANIEVGKTMRIFTQLGSTFRFLSPVPATPEIEENHLSIHQLFADYQYNKNWMIRLGRQEIGYGSHRLITFREGPNTRLTFDAAIARHSSEKRELDILVLTPVVSKKGAFDDETFKDLIAGVYSTEKILPENLSIDWYFLHFESKRRAYNYQKGTDSRRIAGVRVSSQSSIVSYEAEMTCQFGKFNTQRVRAYGVFADVNFLLIPRGKAMFGIAGNYVSGDKNRDDNLLNTYNPLFSKPLYGLTAPIGISNIVSISPYFRVSPAPKYRIYGGAYFMRRQSTQDGIYTPNGTQARPKPDRLFYSTEKKLGTLLSLETNYTVSRHISFAIDISHFFAGNFIEQTGKGKDITYLSFKAGYKF